MLTDFLKPPVQPIYPPGYRKPSRPSIDDLAGRATQAKEANKEYLDAISDTYRRIRQQSAAYFTRDEVAFRSGQIEPYPSTTLVDALNKLLEARTQLSNLLTYMDGKTGAEDLIGKVLQDPTLLQALASAPKPQSE